MKTKILSIFLTISICVSASVSTPFYEVGQVGNKYGLWYNGEFCQYPIYDGIELIEPFRQTYDADASIKEMKQQIHEIFVGNKQNNVTFGAYSLNGKKGLMTMSHRVTEPIFNYVKPYRKLRTFKKKEDQIIAFAIVGDDNGKGVIDLNGNIIIPLEYTEIAEPIFIDEFECSKKNNNNIFFQVVDKSGANNIIDINNKIIFPADKISDNLIKDLRKAEKKNNKNKDYANATDEKIQSIVDAYNKTTIEPLKNGGYELAKCKPVNSSVFCEGTTYGVKNSAGEIIIPAIFDKISHFNEDGVAEVQINDNIGYVNEHGFISMPITILSINLLVAPYEKTMNMFNVAFDVYPTNTYIWLAAADYLMNSGWATTEGRVRNYELASDCYEMALTMAKERDEMYYISEENLADAENAKSYAKGTAAPVYKQVISSGWSMAADIFNALAGFTSTLQNIGTPNATFTPFEADNLDSTSNLNHSSNKVTNSTKSARHGSISETTAKNTESRAYSNYETQLINMKTGVDDYNDSRRRDIQRKMRQIRTKWELRGYNFYHSEMEDWGGK